MPESGCATSLESQESLILEEERAKGNLEWNDGNQPLLNSRSWLSDGIQYNSLTQNEKKKAIKVIEKGEYFYKIGVRKGVKDKKQARKTDRFD